MGVPFLDQSEQLAVDDTGQSRVSLIRHAYAATCRGVPPKAEGLLLREDRCWSPSLMVLGLSLFLFLSLGVSLPQATGWPILDTAQTSSLVRPQSTSMDQTQSRLSDDAIPPASGGCSRCMILYDRPLAIPRLSPLIFGCVPAYEWPHPKSSRGPLSLSGSPPPKAL